MENIDNASEISDISHIKKVCQLLEVIFESLTYSVCVCVGVGGWGG